MENKFLPFCILILQISNYLNLFYLRSATSTTLLKALSHVGVGPAREGFKNHGTLVLNKHHFPNNCRLHVCERTVKNYDTLVLSKHHFPFYLVSSMQLGIDSTMYEILFLNQAVEYFSDENKLYL